jgi:hypothetical protein
MLCFSIFLAAFGAEGVSVSMHKRQFNFVVRTRAVPDLSRTASMRSVWRMFESTSVEARDLP